MPRANTRKLSDNKKRVEFAGNITFLVPVLWIIVLAISLLDTITYNGFFLKHTSINPIILYVFLGLLETLGLFEFKQKENNYFKYFQKTNLYFSILLALLFIAFSFIEKITYTNFVFSRFHVDISALIFPVILTAYTNFVLIGLRYLVLTPLGLIFGLVIINNLFDVWVKNRDNFLYILNHPNASYQEKMEISVGKQFYDYVSFVKENTPENSKILLPPFPAYPWPQSGNPPYMRYFLYPRTLLNGGEFTAGYDLKKERIDYVLLDWGEIVANSSAYTHGWPKFDVNADQIIFWAPDGRIATKNGSYIYNQVKGQELWGLIKVKK
jgi:hypothetical protein